MARITIVATGGTRAPDALKLIQRFRADGHEVRLIASRNALRFLFSHMIRRPWKFFRFLRHFRPYLVEWIAYYREKITSVPHISEGKWCDVMVMAPASCNSTGKLVSGASDNYPLLSIRALPRRKRVIVVPSMNPEMWFDPFLQRNIDLLNATEKFKVLCPARGDMLCGDFGMGAQVPFEEIVMETYAELGIANDEVTAFFGGKSDVGPRLGQPENQNPDAGDKVSVVIIDEDEALATALSDELKKTYGHLDVRLFNSGTEGFNWIRENAVTIVVTELALSGGVTGYDIIEFLRKSPDKKDVIIIAIGSRGRSAVGAEELGRQDVLYVPKPLNMHYVVGMIAGSAASGRRLASEINLTELQAGEILFKQGDRGTEVYVVKSGRLRIIREEGDRRTVLATVGESGMVGEMAFIGNPRRSATVEAMEKTTLIVLNLDRLKAYLDNQPNWLKVVIESLIAHLHRTSDRLLQVSTAPPDRQE
jgi:ActR/RegA family two-component response regulator/3-polyprenyl-4-hydroxybenzoate decarboxylase